MKCILISAQLESKARRTAHKWNSASYGEASSDHNNKGWIPSKVTAELSPSLWSVRSDSTALWEGIPNDASQNAVYWGPWHLSLLFPDHFSFHLPSRLSLSILKWAGDIFAGWLLTLAQVAGDVFSRRSGLPYHTFSLHTLSHVKAVLMEAKARHHFKFHKPRTHDLERKKRKITDEARRPHACLLSLSHSHFLSCHSLPADFCEPSLSW